MGIEPTLAAWEAAVLPLNYTRYGAESNGKYNSPEPFSIKGVPPLTYVDLNKKRGIKPAFKGNWNPLRAGSVQRSNDVA